MNKPDNINEKETLNSLENLSDEELVSLKNQAIEDEDYDKAKEIKQEQEKRKKETEEKTKNATKLKEESSKRTKDLKELLGNDEKYEKLMSKIEGLINIMEGVANTNHELAESNEILANRNNKFNEELENILFGFASKMNCVVDDLHTTNKMLTEHINELQESIKILTREIEKNTDSKYGSR